MSDDDEIVFKGTYFEMTRGDAVKYGYIFYPDGKRPETKKDDTSSSFGIAPVFGNCFPSIGEQNFAHALEHGTPEVTEMNHFSDVDPEQFVGSSCLVIVLVFGLLSLSPLLFLL